MSLMLCSCAHSIALCVCVYPLACRWRSQVSTECLLQSLSALPGKKGSLFFNPKLLLLVSVQGGGDDATVCMCGGQKTALCGWFPSSTFIWVLGLEFK